MAVSALVLYGLLPRMVDLWSHVPQLQSIGWAALGVVAVLQFAKLAVLRRARSCCVTRGDTLRRDHHESCFERDQSCGPCRRRGRGGLELSDVDGVGFRGRHRRRRGGSHDRDLPRHAVRVAGCDARVRADWRAHPEEPGVGREWWRGRVRRALRNRVSCCCSRTRCCGGAVDWSSGPRRRWHRERDSVRHRAGAGSSARRCSAPGGGGRSRHRSGFGPSTICRSSPCWWRSTRTPSRVSSCSRSPLRRSSEWSRSRPGAWGSSRRASPGCSRSPASPPRKRCSRSRLPDRLVLALTACRFGGVVDVSSSLPRGGASGPVTLFGYLAPWGSRRTTIACSNAGRQCFGRAIVSSSTNR